MCMSGNSEASVANKKYYGRLPTIDTNDKDVSGGVYSTEDAVGVGTVS
jgi:hypothetical protein